MLKRLVGAVLLGGACLLSACDSLPKFEEQRAARISADITSLNGTLDKAKSDYAAIQGNAQEWKFFAPYAEREDWAKVFTDAETTLADLRKRYDSQVTPILEADKSADTEKLKQQLDGIFAQFDPVKVQMRSVKARMELLRTGYDNAPKWIKDSRQFVAQIDGLVTGAETVVAKAKEDFPKRVADIDIRFQAGTGTGEGDYVGLGKLQADASAALVVAEAEFAKHDAGQGADYAAFADAVELTKANAATAVTTDGLFRVDLESLYKSGTTILADMKTEYSVIIGRSSWDNCCDGSRYSSDAAYPAVVFEDPEVFNYLASLPQGESKGSQGFLAHLYSSWGTLETNVLIDSGVWKKLGINTGASWPNGHDEAQFWVEDLAPIYYHKLTEEVNGEVIIGEWEEVDEDEFGLYADAFGMAIYSKKVGQFADEAVEEAIPVGMDTVGDERYGQWRNDSSGNSFWHYYGQYAFINAMLGPDTRYYRDDYRSYGSWRNDRRSNSTNTASWGYYGANRGTPTYGTAGSNTLQSASYQKSSIRQAGGAKSISKSVRSAGSAARSRGPGGRGK